VTVQKDFLFDRQQKIESYHLHSGRFKQATMSNTNSAEPEAAKQVSSYVEQFRDGLKRLSAKKTCIEEMTSLAESATDDAPVVCKLIETKLLNSPKESKVYTFYLIDSIIKSLSTYNALFTPRICDLFVHAYTTCSTMDLRGKLEAVYNTWKSDELDPYFPWDVLRKIGRFLEQASQLSDEERKKSQLTPDTLSNEARQQLQHTIYLDHKLSLLENDLEDLTERELNLYKYFQRERNGLVMRINDVLDSIQDDMRPKYMGENITHAFVQQPDEFRLHAPSYGEELVKIKRDLDRLNQRQDESVGDIRTHVNTLKQDRIRKDTIRQRKMKIENFLKENCVILNLTPKTEFFPGSSINADFASVIKNFGKRAIDKDSVRRITSCKDVEEVRQPAPRWGPIGSKENVVTIRKESSSEPLRATQGDDMLGLFGGSGSMLFGKREAGNTKPSANESSLFGHKDDGTNEKDTSSNYDHDPRAERPDSPRLVESRNIEARGDVEADSDVEIESVISYDGTDENANLQEHNLQQELPVATKDSKENTGSIVDTYTDRVSYEPTLPASGHVKPRSPSIVNRTENGTSTPSNSASTESLEKFRAEVGKNNGAADSSGLPKDCDPDATMNDSKPASDQSVGKLILTNDKENERSANLLWSSETIGTVVHDRNYNLNGQDTLMQEVVNDFKNPESVFNAPTKSSLPNVEDDADIPESVFNEPTKPLISTHKTTKNTTHETRSQVDDLDDDEQRETIEEKDIQHGSHSLDVSMLQAGKESNSYYCQSSERRNEDFNEDRSLTTIQLSSGAFNNIRANTEHTPQANVEKPLRTSLEQPSSQENLKQPRSQTAASELSDGRQDSDVSMVELDHYKTPIQAPEPSIQLDSPYDSNSPFTKYIPPTPPPPRVPPQKLDSNSDPAPASSTSESNMPLIGFKPPTPPNISHAHVRPSTPPNASHAQMQGQQQQQQHQRVNPLKRSRLPPGDEESPHKRLKASHTEPHASIEAYTHSPPALLQQAASSFQVPLPSPPPPPKAPTSAPPASETSLTGAGVVNSPDQSLTSGVPPPPPPPTKKLSLSEFKLKRQKADLNTVPIALSSVLSKADVAGGTTDATLIGTGTDSEQLLSSQVVAKYSNPSKLKSILYEPVEGQVRAKKRVRWDPVLPEK